MAVIRVDNVIKSYGSLDVLRGVTFEVPEEQTLCILGGSGGGKSTLLKVLIGALRPTSGRVFYFDKDMTQMSRAELDRLRLKFGVMFQSGALLNSMTTGENIALPLEHHTKLDRDTISTMVKIKLQQVGLLQAEGRFPEQISGGMKKRAAVARALAMDPRIMFYDEPSAGLDPIATASIDQLINQLKTTMKMTSVVVTHEMESVRRIADRVVMLQAGKVILDGTLEDLLKSGDPVVQRFVSGDIEGFESASASVQRFHKDLLM